MTKKHKRRLSKSNSIQSKQRITGLFGLFDILGFKEIIKNNNLDYLENIIADLLDSLDSKAITINGADKNQNLSMSETESIVFSDSIILYENIHQSHDGTIPYLGPSLIDKSSVLLRLAFDAGIPLRGAISFGQYIISNKYFLGDPIVEAYTAEKNCNWSGAILCDSAVDVMKKQNFQPIFFMGIKVRPLNPFTDELLIKVPPKSASFSNPTSLFKLESDVDKTHFAIRWDDLTKIRYLLNNSPDITLDDRSQIENRVREMFYDHNKKPVDTRECEKIEIKIQNTVDFTFGCREIPIDGTLVYTPPSKK